MSGGLAGINQNVRRIASRQLRVAVVAPHDVVRRGLVAMLREVLRIGRTTAFDRLGPGQPDGNCDLLIVAWETANVNPLGAERDRNGAPVLLVTTIRHARSCAAALQDGARGVIDLWASPDEWREAIQVVCGGGVYMSASLRIFNERQRRLDKLTARELDVLKLTLRGLSLKEISARLKVGVSSVSEYRRRVRHKAGVQMFSHLVVIAWQEGLLDEM